MGMMGSEEVFLWIRTAALAVTAVGVWAGFRQIQLSREAAVADFENSIYKEYREIIKGIPVRLLLGHDHIEELREDDLNQLYNYIDLCNEQVFLRQVGRIRKDTWIYWRDGIKSNLCRPAFQKAWERIKRDSDGDFSELRRLERTGFIEDPRRWN